MNQSIRNLLLPRGQRVRRGVALVASAALVTGLLATTTGPAHAAANPNPARITAASWYLMEQLLKLQSGTENGGTYADKPHYHNTRAANDPGDYSVRDAEDKGGPSDKTAAYDWTFTAAKSGNYTLIARYSNRLLASAHNAKDPRLDGWREFFGQADSDTGVEGWDFRYNRAATSDESHLWHIHLSEDRDKVTSYANKDALLSVLRGETVEQWRGQSAGNTYSGVSAIADGTGLKVFARGANGALYQDAWNGSTWGWSSAGGEIVDSPSAVLFNSSLRVFARGTDNALWQYVYSGGAWSRQRIGGELASGPSAIVYGGGLRVFGRGVDGAMWQCVWNGSTWTWSKIGGSITSSPSAVFFDSQLRVFARGADGSLWQYYLTGSSWSWQEIGGGILSGPSAVAQGGTLRVFARALDGALWQYWWNGTEWDWQDLGGIVTSGPGAFADGTTIRVFARGGDGSLWQYWWNGTAWNRQGLGGIIT